MNEVEAQMLVDILKVLDKEHADWLLSSFKDPHPSVEVVNALEAKIMELGTKLSVARRETAALDAAIHGTLKEDDLVELLKHISNETLLSTLLARYDDKYGGWESEHNGAFHLIADIVGEDE